MDKDILMAMIGELQSKLESIESDVSSIRMFLPDDTEVLPKLDRIIELLEKLNDK